MSLFEGISCLPEDPILGLSAEFRKETRKEKINLGIGTYKAPDGSPYVFPAVREAEKRLLARQLDKEYLPIEGDLAFAQAVAPLTFGADFSSFAFLHTTGATAALRVGMEACARLGKGPLFFSTPTWVNHFLLAERAGMKTGEYPYYDPKTHRLDFVGLMDAVKKMPAGSLMLLQSCCHNPTGTGLTKEQWVELSLLMKQRKIVPFFDSAYQGFGDGLEEDAFPIRHFAAEGHEMLVAISFSKNFGLYGERVGVLALRTEKEPLTAALASHCKAVVRSQYSLPPCNGSRIIKEILADPLLEAQWKEQLISVRRRVCQMREGLAHRLGSAFDFMLEQQGMFSFIGLNKEQVERLKKEQAIYIPSSGRINVASLTEGALDRVARAIQAVQ